jgi:hypothetical protein
MNIVVVKGRIRNGESMIPYTIIFNTSMKIYRVNCESRTTACPDDAFTSAQEAMTYILEHFGEW